MFWNDLEHVCFSRSTVSFIKATEPTFSANPAVVPEDRPIETYCSNHARAEEGTQNAISDKYFKYRWNRASARVSKEIIKSMMSSVREKVKHRSQLVAKT